MWSRKPTPVARVPAPLPSRSSVEAHVGLAGLALDRWLCGSCAAGFSRTRASIDSACTSKPSARAIGAPAAASLAAAAPMRTSAMRRRKWRGESAGGEARGAAGRQHVVGAGDVVAERGARCRRRRTGSRRVRTRGASASTSAPISCRCSGANALANAIASRGVGDLDDRERAPRRRSGVRRTSCSSAAASASQTSAAGETAATRLPAPCSAWASMSSAARRSSRSPALGAEHDEQVAGPGEAVDADDAPRAGAWPPARRGCRGRRSRRRARRVSVP